MKIETIIERQVDSRDLQIIERAAEDGDGQSRTVTGYAIVFDTPSLTTELSNGVLLREYIDREAVTPELLADSDIVLTMYHDDSRLLARSKKGKGTLRYSIDDKGVKFTAEMPATQYGDEALELIRAGVIDGCSFKADIISDKKNIQIEDSKEGDRTVRKVILKKLHRVYDFTLTPFPAYPATDCEIQRVYSGLAKEPIEEPIYDKAKTAAFVSELRTEANKRII